MNYFFPTLSSGSLTFSPPHSKHRTMAGTTEKNPTDSLPFQAKIFSNESKKDTFFATWDLVVISRPAGNFYLEVWGILRIGYKSIAKKRQVLLEFLHEVFSNSLCFVWTLVHLPWTHQELSSGQYVDLWTTMGELSMHPSYILTLLNCQGK